MMSVIWVLLRIIHINKDLNVFKQKGAVQQDVQTWHCLLCLVSDITS